MRVLSEVYFSRYYDRQRLMHWKRCILTLNLTDVHLSLGTSTDEEQALDTVTRKRTLRSLSLSYQNKDGCAHPTFRMTLTFQKDGSRNWGGFAHIESLVVHSLGHILWISRTPPSEKYREIYRRIRSVLIFCACKDIIQYTLYIANVLHGQKPDSQKGALFSNQPYTKLM